MSKLPVELRKNEIIDAIKSNQVLILSGETGSGKSTFIPYYCYESGRGRVGKIICTQPRRIAAISIATHLSQIIPEIQVSYKVRFKNSSLQNASIIYATDGILLNEIFQDPLLTKYDTIIIDEAHERTVNIDFLLGYLRKVLIKRPDLKCIIMSATLETKLFSKFFDNATVLHVTGRTYTVDVKYQSPIELWDGTATCSYVAGTINAVRQIIDSGEDGDILIFLPTVEDIDDVLSVLKSMHKDLQESILPLHGRLSNDSQALVFQEFKTRRIIVSSNIAETSITVPGIKFVIDSGLARMVKFDANSGINQMPIERISQASANQRAGRCGRTSQGTCIRLYTESDYLSRPKFTTPEIRRTNLSTVILKMLSINLGKPEHFPFIQKPSPQALYASYKQLENLGAISRYRNLTPKGRKISRLPLDPSIGRMLLDGFRNGVFDEMCIIAAALSVGNIITENLQKIKYLTKKVPEKERYWISDFTIYILLWKEIRKIAKFTNELSTFCKDHGLDFQKIREWKNVYQQIVRICKMIGFQSQPSLNNYPFQQIHKSLLGAFSIHIAALQESTNYKTTKDNDIVLWPGSLSCGRNYPWIIFLEIVQTKQIFGRVVAPIETQWILHYLKDKCRTEYEAPFYDPEKGIVVARKRIFLGKLLVSTNSFVNYSSIDKNRAHEIFIDEALCQGKIFPTPEFVNQNKLFCQEIKKCEQKLRTTLISESCLELNDFYDRLLPDIQDNVSLHKFISRNKNESFLIATNEKLGLSPIPDSIHEYPEYIQIGLRKLPAIYKFKIGDPFDGALIKVPYSLFKAIPSFYWEWLLPIYCIQRIELIIDLLQKDNILKYCSKAPAEIFYQMRKGRGPFVQELMDYLQIKLTSDECTRIINKIPKHLWAQLEIHDEQHEVLDFIRVPVEKPEIHNLSLDSISVNHFFEIESYENELTNNLTMEQISLGSEKQLIPNIGFKALHVNSSSVSKKVFISHPKALLSHFSALKVLFEEKLAEEISWSLHTLKIPEKLKILCRPYWNTDDLSGIVERVYRSIILEPITKDILDHQIPSVFIDRCRDKLTNAPDLAYNLLFEIITEYAKCTQYLDRMSRSYSDKDFKIIKDELTNILTYYINYLIDENSSFRFVRLLPRILKAFYFRIECGYLKRTKYIENMANIREYKRQVTSLKKIYVSQSIEHEEFLELLDEMVEELAISCFANGKVVLLYPISNQRIESKLLEIKNLQ